MKSNKAPKEPKKPKDENSVASKQPAPSAKKVHNILIFSKKKSLYISLLLCNEIERILLINHSHKFDCTLNTY